MPEKQIFLVGDRKVTGQTVGFEPKSEPWSQYILEDGTEVKVKAVMVNVARLDDFTPTGEPVYQFQIQQIIATVVPEKLKQTRQ